MTTILDLFHHRWVTQYGAATEFSTLEYTKVLVEALQRSLKEQALQLMVIFRVLSKDLCEYNLDVKTFNRQEVEIRDTNINYIPIKLRDTFQVFLCL